MYMEWHEAGAYSWGQARVYVWGATCLCMGHTTLRHVLMYRLPTMRHVLMYEVA